MPTYEYECRACGSRFDLFQNITEKPVKRCPECKRLKVRRLIGSGAGIIFKGSGFYQTDYRSESYRKQVKEEKGEAGGKPKKEEAKTASSAKPDGKAGGDKAGTKAAEKD